VTQSSVWRKGLIAVALSAAPQMLLGQGQRLTGLSASQLFELADQQARADHPRVAISIYEALARDPELEIRSEARFREGMLLSSLKRYREAAVVFRRLLDEKPDAARVRLELARVLALIGDEGAARRELRQAQATGLPPQVAAAVGQFDQALRSHKPFGGTVEVGLAPDSNINRATQSRTLDTIIAPLTLSSDARQQPGLGVHLSGQAYAKFRICGTVVFVPRVASVATLYRKRSFNDVSSSASLGLEWQRHRDRITPSLGETWRWYGGKSYARTDAIAVDWLRAVGDRAQLVMSASASRADYKLNDLQDGFIFALSASVEKALSSRAGISLTAFGDRQTARDPGYATARGGFSLLGWRETGRTTLFAAGSIQRTEGDAALILFGDRRREWLFSARAGATFRHLTIHGLAPYVRLNFERNRSSLQLYDYRRIAAEFGVTRAF